VFIDRLNYYIIAKHNGKAPIKTYLGAPVSMTPDDFFTHIKADANSLVKSDCINPVLGQFISFFVSRYSMMLGYTFYSDFIRSIQFF
jgi:hypothetical protein